MEIGFFPLISLFDFLAGVCWLVGGEIDASLQFVILTVRPFRDDDVDPWCYLFSSLSRLSVYYYLLRISLEKEKKATLFLSFLSPAVFSSPSQHVIRLTDSNRVEQNSVKISCPECKMRRRSFLFAFVGTNVSILSTQLFPSIIFKSFRDR